MNKQKKIQDRPRVFIMDAWIYPYRTPIFEILSQRVNLEVFFSLPRPFDHRDDMSSQRLRFKSKTGQKFLFLIPFHILFRRYDVYIVGQIGVQSLLGALFVLLVARFRGKPLVLWTDYIETDYYRRRKKVKRFVGDRVAKFYTRRCSAMLALGEYTRRYLSAISGKEGKVVSCKQVVPEACNPPSPPRERPNAWRDKTIILSMSYFRKDKGLELLVDVFKKIDPSSALLIMAGSGEEEAKLMARAADDPRIEWTGHVEGADKAFLYSQADIFVLPTYHDTWGLVVNEAMYYGLPVIVSDAAGASELISDNGVVFKAGDLKALHSAMEKLLRNPDLRRRMGEKSRAYIANYGLDYGVRSFVEIIERVLGRKID